MIREVRREGEGAAYGECGCSSLRVRWWWMLTTNSHGVEISMAGCVEEMVRAPNPMSSFFSFSFSFSFSYFKFCFYLRPKAEAISTKIARIRNGYGRNKLPPSPTHFQGGGNRGRKDPWSKTCTKGPGAENYNKIYMKLATKRKHLPKTPSKPNS